MNNFYIKGLRTLSSLLSCKSLSKEFDCIWHFCLEKIGTDRVLGFDQEYFYTEDYKNKLYGSLNSFIAVSAVATTPFETFSFKTHQNDRPRS